MREINAVESTFKFGGYLVSDVAAAGAHDSREALRREHLITLSGRDCGGGERGNQ